MKMNFSLFDLFNLFRISKSQIGPFSKLRKLGNWQFADCNRHINCYHRGPEADFYGVLKHHSFLYKAQNICTNKQLRVNKHSFIFQFWCATHIPGDTIFKPI